MLRDDFMLMVALINRRVVLSAICAAAAIWIAIIAAFAVLG